MAILSGNGGHILDYEGIDRATSPIPPMVMVPTTAGTGSDVSQFCVVTDTKRRIKATIGGRAIVPEISLTDPELLTTMSAELTAHTGLDALSHAIESCVSEACDFLSKGHAIAAIQGIVEHLPVAAEDPFDLTAREGMARASLQAGMAFTNALLGATHAIAHQIGGALDLPHGLLNAILMPHVMRFNAETHADRYVDVAGALGVATDGLDANTAAERAIEHVEELEPGPRHPQRAARDRRRPRRLRHVRGERAARRLHRHQPEASQRGRCPPDLHRRLLSAPPASTSSRSSA